MKHMVDLALLTTKCQFGWVVWDVPDLRHIWISVHSLVGGQSGTTARLIHMMLESSATMVPRITYKIIGREGVF